MKAIEELGLNLGLHVTLLPNYSFCTIVFIRSIVDGWNLLNFEKFQPYYSYYINPRYLLFRKKSSLFFWKDEKSWPGNLPLRLYGMKTKANLSSFFLQMKVSKPKRRPLLPSNITSLLRIFFSLELNSTKFRKSLFSRIYLCELCKIYFFAWI